MIRWSLKTRVGLAAATLSVLALVTGLMVARPLIYKHQLEEVDDNLARNADELWRDMEEIAVDRETAKTDAPTAAATEKPPIRTRGAATPQKAKPAAGITATSPTATGSSIKKDLSPRGPDPRKPLPRKFIPATLNGRYLQVHGIDGIKIYASDNLQGFVMSGEPGEKQTVLIKGRNCRVGTFSHGVYTAHIGMRLGSLESTQDDVLQASLRILPVLGFVVFCLGWGLGYLAVRPVSVLTEAAEKIDAANPDTRLPLLDASNEIVRLTEVLNGSYDRLQAAYASAARFSADASHQLKTPIAVLRAGLDNLRAQPSLPPEIRTEVDALMKQTRRLTTLTEDLLLLAQIDAGRLRLESEPLDVADLARAIQDDVEVLAAARDLNVESAIPESLMVVGDARRTSLILQNLTENAAKYAGENGCIRLSVCSDGKVASVCVANTGPAISAEDQERLFERFYRAGTGENISGHGLGLNIARGLAQAQGGDLKLTRSDGEWTEFCLTLRLAESPEAAA